MLAGLPVTSLKGVGTKAAEWLRQLHIITVQDLLFHLPLRYEDRTRITPLSQITAGARVVIEGRVVRGYMQYGSRPSLIAQLQDETGEIFLRFFHFTGSQSALFMRAGTAVRCFGVVRPRYRGGGFEMIHPQYGDSTQQLSDTLTPVYECGAHIQQATWRKLVQQALECWDKEEVLTPLLPDVRNALRLVHNPPPDADMGALLAGTHPCQQCLALEELVAHQLAMIPFRQTVSSQVAEVLIDSEGMLDLQERFIRDLPFVLTAAQQRVMQDINRDLSKNKPMLRLLQGDVGSGKTVVAALALLRAVACKKQAALMAPTELLAEQHWQFLSQCLVPLGIRVGRLSGRMSAGEHQKVCQALHSHQIDIIVGTHALFQERVQFASLALIVIDEQHRFGVEQRFALKQKGAYGDCYPHQLMMTATPIPRTLAMSVYADLDVSVIDALPPGRQPVKTLLMSNHKRDAVIESMRTHCKSGRQAYWVCTLIEDSETLRAEAAEVCYEHLREVLPGLQIALIHGRLKSDEKETIMSAFKQGQIDLLVATTVIEVGVDVPNASLMIVENAERLGLAQLHQLRGRVGRGEQASFCVLLYQMPLSGVAQKKLQIMRDHTDGFYIAEQDLQIRGPGEVWGTRQTGLWCLKIADLLRDAHLLPEARRISQQIIGEAPFIIPTLVSRWLSDRTLYGSV